MGRKIDKEFAKRVRLLRNMAGLSQDDAAAKLKIKFRTYQTHEAGQRPNRSTQAKYLAFYGCDPHWFLTGEGEAFPSGPQSSPTPTPPDQTPSTPPPHGVAHGYAAARAPISPEEMTPAVDIPDPPPFDREEFGLVPLSAARLSAGGGAFVITENIRAYYAFRKEWLHRVTSSPRQVILMVVEGDSMAPTICQGDTVLIDVGRRHIYPGRIYALGIDDTIMIKRLDPMMDGSVRVISDSRADYPPQIVDRRTLRVIGQVIWYARELV